MLFQVSYERFLEEIRNEKIEEGNRNQLEEEDLGNMLAYYLNSLDRPQTYVFVVEKEVLWTYDLILVPEGSNSIFIVAEATY